jgi:2-polyprenyl-3-methyl-5-hydroxy-6-metoxy-1,4-benzoquinol methylase
MTENKTQNIDLDDVMQKIREEVAHRKTPAASENHREQYIPKHQDPVQLSDLINYYDEAFIVNVYQKILHRDVDSAGLEYYLPRLRRGEISKTEIIGRLRYSKEGRIHRVKIRGLFLKFALKTVYRVPIVGFFVELAISLFSLPKLLKHIREHQAFTDTRFASVATSADLKANTELLHHTLAGKAEVQQVQQLQLQGERLQSALLEKANAEHVDRLMSGKADMQQLRIVSQSLSAKADMQFVQDLHEKAENIKKDILARINDHSRALLDQQRRLVLFLDELKLKRSDHFVGDQAGTMTAEQDHLLDSFYIAFEDRFRGTRADIKERVKVYLPYVEKIKQDRENSLILDIGCGRGEWLEVLKENGIQAIGIDSNRVMIDECKKVGLDAHEAAVVDFLRRQEPSSYGVITGFHVIEHISFHDLTTLLNEAGRALKTGGMLILETPNPENLLVGSCNFYFDPTHNHPIPPEPMKFLLEQHGYTRVEIKRLHKVRETEPTGQSSVDEIVHRFNMEQDYAVIGYKQ